MRLTRDDGHVPLLYVTENGAAFRDQADRAGEIDDGERVRFLHVHFAAAQRVFQAGANLQGYDVWAFMDTFEWADGYTKRFGLVYMDYGTERRIATRSTLWYRNVIHQNGIPTDL